ncbi:MAG: S24/S26 family peptidase [Opitutaceae bacterium]|nr:S24/S26 family peptidase [Opitutaceae bacterium]
MSYFSGILQVKLFGQNSTGAPGPTRGLAAIAALGSILGWGGGCATAPLTPPEPTVAPSANVDVNEAWRDAKLVAAREPGRIPVVGTGSSMQPVYGDNTMLVVRPVDYDDLRAGMTVAYVDHTGVRVVHRLVEKVADGWRVLGLNNERVDNELVTRKNLIGAVYASFNYDAEEPPKK